MMYPRTFIIGSPRSGTTWVAKLFDANPWVLYRHEPDSAIPETRIPSIINQADYDQYMEAAGAYVDRLFSVSTVKTNAGKVSFPKAFRNGIGEFVHRGWFIAARGIEQFSATRQFARRIHIPDMINTTDAGRIHQVCKSVIAGGRAGLYARARPDVRFVMVMRHPAGVVGSELRGKSLGKMPGNVPIGALATMPGAQQRGLTLEFFESADQVERLSWWWVLFNEKMIADTEGLENCLLVNYDEMCADPAAALRKMYAHAQIEVSEEVEAFLQKSTSESAGDGSYFDLFRDPLKAANRWRSELTDEQVARIQAIAADTAPGSQFQF